MPLQMMSMSEGCMCKCSPTKREASLAARKSRCLLRPVSQSSAIPLTNVLQVGTIQPIAEVADALAALQRPDLLLHSDMAQSLGKVAVDVKALNVDAATVRLCQTGLLH